MRTITTLMTCAVAFTAQAEQMFDGTRLQALCRNNREAAEAYLGGWHDKREVDMTFATGAINMLSGENFARRIYAGITGPYCLPDNVTEKQLADVACAYIEGHPQEHADKGVGIISSAMEDRYPCPK